MKTLFSMGIVLSALIISVSSCKKNDTVTNNPGTGNDINLATSSSLGKYLTNKQGLSLYMFANDADGIHVPAQGDAKLPAPAFTTDLATAKLDAGLNAVDFATIQPQVVKSK